MNILSNNLKRVFVKTICTWTIGLNLWAIEVNAETLEACKTRVRSEVFNEANKLRPVNVNGAEVFSFLNNCVRTQTKLQGSLLAAHYLCKEAIKLRKTKAKEGCLQPNEYRYKKVLFQLKEYLDEIGTFLSRDKNVDVLHKKFDPLFSTDTFADLQVTNDISPEGIRNLVHDSIAIPNSPVMGRLVYRSGSLATTLSFQSGSVYSMDIVGVCNSTNFLSSDGYWYAFNDYQFWGQKPYIVYFKNCEKSTCSNEILGDPLHYLATMDEDKFLKYLLEDQGEKSLNLKKQINAVNADGFTPLHVASQVGASSNLIQVLIQNGASEKLLNQLEVTASDTWMNRLGKKPFWNIVQWAVSGLNAYEIDQLNGIYNWRNDEKRFLQALPEINTLLWRYNASTHNKFGERVNIGLVAAIKEFLALLNKLKKDDLMNKLPLLLKYFSDLNQLVQFIGHEPINRQDILADWETLLNNMQLRLVDQPLSGEDIVDQNKHLIKRLDYLSQYYSNLASLSIQSELLLSRRNAYNNLNNSVKEVISSYLKYIRNKPAEDIFSNDPDMMQNIYKIKIFLDKLPRNIGNNQDELYTEVNRLIDERSDFVNSVLNPFRTMDPSYILTQEGADLLIKTVKRWNEFVKNNPKKHLYLNVAREFLKKEKEIDQFLSKNEAMLLDHLKVLIHIEKGNGKKPIFKNMCDRIRKYLNHVTNKYTGELPFIILDTDSLKKHRTNVSALLERSIAKGDSSEDNLKKTFSQIDDLITLKEILASKPKSNSKREALLMSTEDNKFNEFLLAGGFERYLLKNESDGEDEDQEKQIVAIEVGNRVQRDHSKEELKLNQNTKPVAQKQDSSPSAQGHWLTSLIPSMMRSNQEAVKKDKRSFSELYQRILRQSPEKDKILAELGANFKKMLSSIDDDHMTLFHHLAQDLYSIYKGNGTNGFSHMNSIRQLKLLFILWTFVENGQSQWGTDNAGFSFSDYIEQIISEELVRLSKR